MQPSKPKGPGSSSRAAEILRLLTLLARRGAWCQSAGGASGGLSPTVYVPRHDGAHALGSVDAGTLQAALRSGWLVAASDPSCWRLGDSGRMYLKRALSGAADIRRQEPATKERRARPRTGLVTEPGVNPCESPLAWLSRRKDKDGNPFISRLEFEAGERLRADFWYGQMTPRVTANWSPVAARGRGGRGGADAAANQTDNVLAAQERVRRALAAVGPELAGVLVDICCHLKGLEQIERRAGWPQRSGKVALHFALMSLARHYGMSGTGTSAQGATDDRVRVRHWGTADYRPALDTRMDEKEE